MKKKMSVKKCIRQQNVVWRKGNVKVPRITVGYEILKNNIAMNTLIKKELQDYFDLLDLGISAVIEMHNVCKRKRFVYASITAKMVSLLLSMRTLLRQGHMDGVKSLYRPFQEMIEIFFACLIDKQFTEEYGNPNVLYDNNDFWKKNINGNKLDRFVNKIFDDLGYPKQSKKEYFKRRDDGQKFLSQTVHASFNSTFSSFLMPTINWKMSDNVYGKITTAYPMMMYELLTDINMLNAIFYAAVDDEVAFDFSRKDISGKQNAKYHYFAQVYDETYDACYQQLYKRGYDIVQSLKKTHEEAVKMEQSETIK